MPQQKLTVVAESPNPSTLLRLRVKLPKPSATPGELLRKCQTFKTSGARRRRLLWVQSCRNCLHLVATTAADPHQAQPSKTRAEQQEGGGLRNWCSRNRRVDWPGCTC